MYTLKGVEKIIRESAFDKKKKKLSNPGLALTGIRTTGPADVWSLKKFKKTIIPFGLVGYEIVIANS